MTGCATTRPASPACRPLSAPQRPGPAAKAQVMVRQILDTVYGAGPGGLPGNDDQGTMSAWCVFSARGLYPQTPGSATMLLGTPLLPDASIDRVHGRDITIGAPDADAGHPYVDAVRVDGRTGDRSWTDASLVTRGATLALRSAEAPNSSWGTATSRLPR
ncbi:glycoside hydrolase domain-containing protein [Streptomyces sp. NPDC056333]|uniref:glycoside hydrolase domain-containing protein n=1 Tax=Streptomyces sp. NPDC056333 TaxID=3345786 RepID=UPI0035DA507E